jgi:glucuronate isomerase
MNNKFINDDFILQTKQSQELYHDYAKNMPIIDYHCHLPPKEVDENKTWTNITEIWLNGDHYKWRTMRSNGIEEKFCTGDASDYEKFEKFAETMPKLLRNPMYHWCHLELARYFDIDDLLLSPDTAKEIWDRTEKVINKENFTSRNLMKDSNVVLICTTDDPLDNLKHHIAVKKSGFEVQMLPTWRPDKAMAVEKTEVFVPWVEKLEELTSTNISSFDGFMDAINQRMDYFDSIGCKLSDHGLETVYAEDCSRAEADTIFKKAKAGKDLSKEEVLKFKSIALYELTMMNAEHGWTQQIHYGAMRNNNTLMFNKLGPDTGFDSIGDFEIGRPLSKLMDRLNMKGKLAKTILYNLNPSDNYLLATMLGNFQGSEIPGKIQFGSGWWFLDQMEGMKQHIEAVSNESLLSRFVGMLTDSRSFLSYTRHEYFRRILCNILGDDMAKGLIPNDTKLVGNMVKDISYNNAAAYFGFDNLKKY